MQTLVDQIGFYRSMATSCSIGSAALVLYRISGHYHLPLPLWVPIFVLTTFAFAARYRRFWIRLGDYVLRPAWWGDVRPRRRTYRLEIHYLDPLDRPFPNRPHVFVPFLFPRLPNPHGLEDHSLCLDFPRDPSSRRWIPSDGIVMLIDWSAIWLLTYELWLTSALMDEDRVWLHPAV